MVPRTIGLGLVPWGSRTDQPGGPPSYLRKSKTHVTAHLRTLFCAGHPGVSVEQLSVDLTLGPCH